MRDAKNVLSKIIEWGVYLLVFLLPWQARLIWQEGRLAGGYWEYGTFSLYGTELLLLVLVVLNIVQVVKKQVEKREKRKEKLGTTTNVKLLNCSIVLLFIVAAASVLWAGDSGLALYRFVTLLEGLMIFWLIVTSGVSWKRLAWVIVLSGVVQAGVGFWQFLGQAIPANKWLGVAFQDPVELGTSVVQTPLRRWLRAHGTLPHPNILGGWLVVGLLMMLGLYECEYKKKSPSILKIVTLLNCYIVILFGLLTTFSRGAWLAFAIVFLFYCFIVFMKKDETRRIISYKLLIIMIIVAAVFGFVFREPFMARLTGEGRLETKSTEERLAGYEEAGALLAKNWLTGVGVGNYTLYKYNANLRMNANAANDANMIKHSWDYQPVHNLFLLVWAEIGIFGLLFLVAILLFIIYYLLFIKKITLIYVLPLLTIFILSFFDHYFWSLYFGVMMWWLVLGFSLKARG